MTLVNIESIPNNWETSNLSTIADYLNGLAMQKFRTQDEKGLPEHNLDVWYAFFGKKEADTPDGQVMLFVDKNGYVSSVKVTVLKNDNKDINYSIAVGSALWTMGLTSEETQHLMTGGETKDGVYISEVQNAAQNKHFILMTAEETDRIQVMIMAADDK